MIYSEPEEYPMECSEPDMQEFTVRVWDSAYRAGIEKCAEKSDEMVKIVWDACRDSMLKKLEALRK